jgi:hypothetical protein
MWHQFSFDFPKTKVVTHIPTNQLDRETLWVPNTVLSLLQDLENNPDSQDCPNCWELFDPIIWCKSCGYWIIVEWVPRIINFEESEQRGAQLLNEFSYWEFKVIKYFLNSDWFITNIFFKFRSRTYWVELKYYWNNFEIKVSRNWKICNHTSPVKFLTDVKLMCEEFIKYKAFH